MHNLVSVTHVGSSVMMTSSSSSMACLCHTGFASTGSVSGANHPKKGRTSQKKYCRYLILELTTSLVLKHDKNTHLWAYNRAQSPGTPPWCGVWWWDCSLQHVVLYDRCITPPCSADPARRSLCTGGDRTVQSINYWSTHDMSYTQMGYDGKSYGLMPLWVFDRKAPGK